MKIYAKIVFITLFLLSCSIAAQTADVKTPEATGVIFENVRIFNGSAAELSAPLNVQVTGNVIKSISADPIANPDGMKVT
jgi:PBP1b-binding outer membrane lipoprotein LpoB